MRYNTIAGTDITVSELGFGVWTLSAGWWGDNTDDQAIALLREARDLGVTLFDTAETYGNGRGETILAEAFTPEERPGLVIATKFGYDWQHRPAEELAGHQEAPHCWDMPFLANALDASLRRLNTDYIDIWQLHNPSMDALQDDALWTFLDKTRASGKVRSIGVALGPAIGWLDEGHYGMQHRSAELVHIIYNALELDPGRALLAEARRTKRSVLVRVPHSSGLLEGHYTAGTTFAENDHRRHRPHAWLINGLKKIEQLQFLTRTGSTLGQAAMRYVLHEPEVVSALPNIYNRDQLHEFASSADCADLTDTDMAEIARLYDRNYGLPRELEQGVAPEQRKAATS